MAAPTLIFFAPYSLELPFARLLRTFNLLALGLSKLDGAFNEALHSNYSVVLLSG